MARPVGFDAAGLVGRAGAHAAAVAVDVETAGGADEHGAVDRHGEDAADEAVPCARRQDAAHVDVRVPRYALQGHALLAGVGADVDVVVGAVAVEARLRRRELDRGPAPRRDRDDLGVADVGDGAAVALCVHEEDDVTGREAARRRALHADDGGRDEAGDVRGERVGAHAAPARERVEVRGRRDEERAVASVAEEVARGSGAVLRAARGALAELRLAEAVAVARAAC
jgi:hypothetical protein